MIRKKAFQIQCFQFHQQKLDVQRTCLLYVTCVWAKGNHFHPFTAFLHASGMLQFGFCYHQDLGQHEHLWLWKSVAPGSEPETCLVVVPYVGIFQSCLGAKQPKILPLGLSLDLWAMLPTLWSELVTDSMEQNPYGEASQIPCFFMEPGGSSPCSQKLTIYPCSEHDQLRPSSLYTCPPFTVSPATSALYLTLYLQLYPLSCYESLTYKKISSLVGFHFLFHREEYNPSLMHCFFVPSSLLFSHSI